MKDSNEQLTLDQERGRVVDLTSRVLRRARVISSVAGRNGVNGEQRDARV